MERASATSSAGSPSLLCTPFYTSGCMRRFYPSLFLDSSSSNESSTNNCYYRSSSRSASLTFHHTTSSDNRLQASEDALNNSSAPCCFTDALRDTSSSHHTSPWFNASFDVSSPASSCHLQQYTPPLFSHHPTQIDEEDRGVNSPSSCKASISCRVGNDALVHSSLHASPTNNSASPEPHLRINASPANDRSLDHYSFNVNPSTSCSVIDSTAGCKETANSLMCSYYDGFEPHQTTTTTPHGCSVSDVPRRDATEFCKKRRHLSSLSAHDGSFYLDKECTPSSDSSYHESSVFQEDRVSGLHTPHPMLWNDHQTIFGDRESPTATGVMPADGEKLPASGTSPPGTLSCPIMDLSSQPGTAIPCVVMHTRKGGETRSSLPSSQENLASPMLCQHTAEVPLPSTSSLLSFPFPGPQYRSFHQSHQTLVADSITSKDDAAHTPSHPSLLVPTHSASTATPTSSMATPSYVFASSNTILSSTMPSEHVDEQHQQLLSGCYLASRGFERPVEHCHYPTLDASTCSSSSAVAEHYSSPLLVSPLQPTNAHAIKKDQQQILLRATGGSSLFQTPLCTTPKHQTTVKRMRKSKPLGTTAFSLHTQQLSNIQQRSTQDIVSPTDFKCKAELVAYVAHKLECMVESFTFKSATYQMYLKQFLPRPEEKQRRYIEKIEVFPRIPTSAAERQELAHLRNVQCGITPDSRLTDLNGLSIKERLDDILTSLVNKIMFLLVVEFDTWYIHAPAREQIRERLLEFIWPNLPHLHLFFRDHFSLFIEMRIRHFRDSVARYFRDRPPRPQDPARVTAAKQATTQVAADNSQQNVVPSHDATPMATRHQEGLYDSSSWRVVERDAAPRVTLPIAQNETTPQRGKPSDESRQAPLIYSSSANGKDCSCYTPWSQQITSRSSEQLPNFVSKLEPDTASTSAAMYSTRATSSEAQFLTPSEDSHYPPSYSATAATYDNTPRSTTVSEYTSASPGSAEDCYSVATDNFTSSAVTPKAMSFTSGPRPLSHANSSSATDSGTSVSATSCKTDSVDAKPPPGPLRICPSWHYAPCIVTYRSNGTESTPCYRWMPSFGQSSYTSVVRAPLSSCTSTLNTLRSEQGPATKLDVTSQVLHPEKRSNSLDAAQQNVAQLCSAVSRTPTTPQAATLLASQNWQLPLPETGINETVVSPLPLTPPITPKTTLMDPINSLASSPAASSPQYSVDKTAFNDAGCSVEKDAATTTRPTATSLDFQRPQYYASLPAELSPLSPSAAGNFSSYGSLSQNTFNVSQSCVKLKSLPSSFPVFDHADSSKVALATMTSPFASHHSSNADGAGVGCMSTSVVEHSALSPTAACSTCEVQKSPSNSYATATQLKQERTHSVCAVTPTHGRYSTATPESFTELKLLAPQFVRPEALQRDDGNDARKWDYLRDIVKDPHALIMPNNSELYLHEQHPSVVLQGAAGCNNLNFQSFAHQNFFSPSGTPETLIHPDLRKGVQTSTTPDVEESPSYSTRTQLSHPLVLMQQLPPLMPLTAAAVAGAVSQPISSNSTSPRFLSSELTGDTNKQSWYSLRPSCHLTSDNFRTTQS